jgi:RimJ/RimL family protein N-acetyltransferase
MQLRTERLIIRPWEPSDAPALYESKLASHEHLKQWMPWAQKPPASIEDENATIEMFLEQQLGDRHQPGAVFLRDGTFIGACGSWILQKDVPSFEIGYWLDARHLDKGYMTEAVRAKTEALFQQYGANRVVIECNVRNEGSANIARRLNFTHEGTLRNERRHVDGTLADSHVFAHTPESWKP